MDRTESFDLDLVLDDFEPAPPAQPKAAKTAPREFGDTKSLEGLLRLVEFVKQEHLRRKRVQDPLYQSKLAKVGIYKTRMEDPLGDHMKKGLQLHKAA